MDGMAENLNTITRKELYKPIPRADIIEDAKKNIIPEEVPVMEPSTLLEGGIISDPNDPLRFLAGKLSSITENEVKNKDAKADPRLYFLHPLLFHEIQFPVAEIQNTKTASKDDPSPHASFAHTQNINLIAPEKDDGDDQRTAKILANLGYTGDGALADYKRDYSLDGMSDDEAVARLESFHQNPAEA
jgi:hypothetical protein